MSIETLDVLVFHGFHLWPPPILFSYACSNNKNAKITTAGMFSRRAWLTQLTRTKNVINKAISPVTNMPTIWATFLGYNKSEIWKIWTTKIVGNQQTSNVGWLVWLLATILQTDGRTDEHFGQNSSRQAHYSAHSAGTHIKNANKSCSETC